MRATSSPTSSPSPTRSGSSIAREADGVLYTHAGPEIGVAATKTFATQMAALHLVALYLAQVARHALPRGDRRARRADEGAPGAGASARSGSTARSSSIAERYRGRARTSCSSAATPATRPPWREP